jgi:hypothetical protein
MYHAALTLGIDPVTTFRAAEAIARDESFTGFLEDFLSRSEEDKSLKALGYRDISEPDGFRPWKLRLTRAAITAAVAELSRASFERRKSEMSYIDCRRWMADL